MRRAHSSILLASLITATPAFAQERAGDVDIPAGEAGAAIRALGKQQRVSVGFRDRRIAHIRLKAVRGRLTPTQTLERMLAGTGAYARRVAPATFVIETLPKPRAEAARRAPAPRLAPPDAAPQPLVVPDVVVTATKRDVPLASYPGGAQVIAGDSLSMADGARGTGLIEARAASVTSTHLGPGRNKLFIRGIADSSFVGPTQATVGQYWGNSRITYSAPDPSLRLYDVKSIEVLEGPQGTLYGAGSLGGVVRVVPNAPDLGGFGGLAWGGVQAVEHGDPGVDGGAIVNLPLVEDRLALRVLGFGNIDGGYIDDRERGLDNVNRVDTIGGRAALRFAPGDDWTIDLSGLGQRIVGDDSQYADRIEDGLSRESAIAQPYRNEYWLADLVVAKRWDDIELTTSLAYARQHVFEQFEGPALFDPAQPGLPPNRNAPPTAFAQRNRIRMLMGEARLARRGPDGKGWLVGASLLHNSAQIRRRTGAMMEQSFLTGVRNKVEEATLYGEYTLAPLDRLTITGGGRLTHTKLGGRSEDVPIELALRFDPTLPHTRTETHVMPSIAFAYRPSDELTLFARYQEGFRPGGIAVRQEFIQSFYSDSVRTAEAGIRFSGDSVDTSITLSRTLWRSIQADIVDGFGFPTTANIGDGRIWSLGWMGKWRPIKGLELDAAFYLNDSRIVRTEFDVLPLFAGTIDQSRLPNVAGESARLGVTYSAPVGARDQVDVRGYLRYIGQSTLGIGAILGRLQGDYVDTGLELRLGDARRGISLTATNLLDTRGNRFALGSPFLIRSEDQITPLQPRSIRLGFDIAF